MPVAVLIHLNGPPAVGKSTIAAHLVVDQPSALAVDIDEIRVGLDAWDSDPESKTVARRLGFDMAQAHLRSGHDVVLSQLLVADDALDQIARIAQTSGADRVEVILVADPDELVGRAREARGHGGVHPRDLLPLDELEAHMHHALARLRTRAAANPSARIVDVTGLGRADATARVRAVIDRPTDPQPLLR